jgi:phosphoribosylanthranilate isomerase
MRLWIKICGLTSPEAVAMAVECGADALGFVFHAGSARDLTPARAAELARDVPRHVLRVAVTRHPAQSLVAAIAAGFAPDLLQTDLADLAAVRLPAGLGVLPVLRAGAVPAGALPGVAARAGAARAPLPARFLYEGSASGSGLLADWREAAALARQAELVLAGGLTPANVAEAVTAVRPFGVDVSSGVEDAPGRKDPERIRAFVAAARAAADALGSAGPAGAAGMA